MTNVRDSDGWYIVVTINHLGHNLNFIYLLFSYCPELRSPNQWDFQALLASAVYNKFELNKVLPTLLKYMPIVLNPRCTLASRGLGEAEGHFIKYWYLSLIFRDSDLIALRQSSGNCTFKDSLADSKVQ